MRKLLYFANIDITEVGYASKVGGMCEGFIGHGCEVSLLIKRKKQVQKIGNINNIFYAGSTLLLYLHLVWVTLRLKPDVLYCRHPRLNYLYILCLCFCRIIFPKIIIVHEIPTFPYDKELGSNTAKEICLKFMDISSRWSLKYLVDLITVIGGYEGQKVFGVRSLNIENGVRTEDFTPYCEVKVCENFKIIGIGNIAKRHAYDRIIHAIAKFRSDDLKITFSIVGNGPELSNLKNLSSNMCFGRNEICFYPHMSGKNLDGLVNSSHIAVGNLGFHRIGVRKSSALKEREYLARGIPFICVHLDERIDPTSAGIFVISSDDAEVDMRLLVKDYLALEVVNCSMYQRNFAKLHLSWGEMVKPILSEVDKCLDI